MAEWVLRPSVAADDVTMAGLRAEARSDHRPEREQHSAREERRVAAELSEPARPAQMAVEARPREEAKVEVTPAVWLKADRPLLAATAFCRSDLAMAQARKARMEFVAPLPVENPAAIAWRRKGAAARRAARLVAPQAAQEELRSAVPMTSAYQVAEQAQAEPTEV